jgi:hypothetical protein
VNIEQQSETKCEYKFNASAQERKHCQVHVLTWAGIQNGSLGPDLSCVFDAGVNFEIDEAAEPVILEARPSNSRYRGDKHGKAKDLITPR